MKNSTLISAIGALMLMAAPLAEAQSSTYTQTPVTISQDKVRKDGVLYYSHVVLEKQTLFSIAKAYGVSIQDIYDANRTLDLETNGLKKYQIILIPVAGAAEQPNDRTEVAAPAATAAPVASTAASAPQDEYFNHSVKWYEDIQSIAKKYGMSAEDLMKYNGLTSSSLTWKQVLKIPYDRTGEIKDNRNYKEIAPVDITPEEALAQKAEQASEETPADKESGIFDNLWFKGKKDVNATLILPFDAKSSSPKENSFDFYCGVLLALRDLQSEGISTDLSVFDCAGGAMPVTESHFKSTDVVLGPISTTDITKALGACNSNAYIISPLEPKAVTLANTYSNVIQTPCSADMQSKDLVNWMIEEKGRNDEVLLITEKGITPTGSSAAIISNLQASGISYQTVSYGVQEGRNIKETVAAKLTKSGTNRIFVVSESKAFINDVVRNINSLVNRKYDIVLYCTSKARSFDDIDVEHFHNANMHVSLSYFVDYDDKKVASFLLAYRALYNAEPSPFAFQGYDTAYYFIKMCSLYGRRWPEKLDAMYGTGLQTDFKFTRLPGGGMINNAVRRIVYEPSFNIKLVR